jgi:hypothetical protein
MTMPFSPYQLSPDVMRSLQMQSPARPKDNMSLWDKIQNAVAPAPTDGLLGEEDVKNARNQGLLNFGLGLLAQSGPTTHRVSLGQAIGQAGVQGVGAYHDAIDQATQRLAQKQAFDANKLKMTGMQTEMTDQAKARQARDAVFTRLPPPADDSDPKAIAAWIQHAAPALVAAGDTEGAGKLLEMQRQLAGKYQAVQLGDQVARFDPTTGEFTPGPERHMMPDELAMKKAALAEAQARIANTREATTASRQDRLVKAYDTNNKDLFARAVPVNQAMMAIEQAKTDPTVGGNAIIAFMTAVDPKAQQRYQMVNWMSQHLTPSLAATAQRYLEGKTTGLLPKELLNAMAAHVRRTRDITIAQGKRAQAEYERLHPEVKGVLRDIGTEFDADAAPAAADPGSLRGIYGGLK